MLDQLIFVGFNSRVAALNRDTGQTVWTWSSPKGSGYTTIVLDGDRLIVCVMGYTYCLDPLSGQERWFNDLPGMGTGVASLASVRSMAAHSAQAAAEAAASDAATANAATANAAAANTASL
jgi:outer membrane protein assembly factor BamB